MCCGSSAWAATVLLELQGVQVSGKRASVRVSGRQMPPLACGCFATLPQPHLTHVCDTAARFRRLLRRVCLLDLQVIRVTFAREVTDERDAQSTLTMLAQVAWEKERNYIPIMSPVPDPLAH